MKLKTSIHRRPPSVTVSLDTFYDGKPLISDLLQQIRQIDRASAARIDQTVSIVEGDLDYYVLQNNIGTPGQQDIMRHKLLKIRSVYTEIDNCLESMRQHLRNQIKERQHDYLTASYALHDQSRLESSEYILQRKINLSQVSQDLVQSRVMRHGSDWRFPGLIIRPSNETWVESMVALDPLYVVDESWDLLAPFRERFTETYVNRVRMSVVDRNDPDKPLINLPDDQLGFCMAYNFFNFKPFEVMTEYLQELYRKCRAGGVVALTINDADRPGGAQLCERRYACYTPLSMVLGLANSLGFQVYYQAELDAAVTWLELVKPGRLDSFKGGPIITIPLDQNN